MKQHYLHVFSSYENGWLNGEGYSYDMNLLEKFLTDYEKNIGWDSDYMIFPVPYKNHLFIENTFDAESVSFTVDLNNYSVLIEHADGSVFRKNTDDLHSLNDFDTWNTMASFMRSSLND